MRNKTIKEIRIETLIQQAVFALDEANPDRKSQIHGRVTACLVRALHRMRNTGIGDIMVDVHKTQPTGFAAHFELKKPCGGC